MNYLTDKNVLVTGGTGFVGSHLVEELVRQKTNVITTYQNYSPLAYFYNKKLDQKVIMAHVDICDFEKIFELITKNEIEFIFHLAALSLVEPAYYNPRRAYQINIMGTVNILESARLYPKIKGIIVASSDKAYGKLSKDKYQETDSLRGDHPYEASKAAADLISYSYFKTYKLPVVITRFGNIYGEGDLNFSRIIPGIMKAVVRDEKFEVRSNGKYVRDYLYVKDVIKGYIMLASNIDRVKGEAFNFGSDETLSVVELIKLVEKILKKKVNYKILNIAKNEIPYQSLDYAKIRKTLGWKPRYSLSQTIKQIFQWYKKLNLL